MKIKIKRFLEKSYQEEFEIEESSKTLLETLIFIKEKRDNSLTFRYGCRSEVCGSCAVVVNGKERLACKYKVQNGDIIEPLKRVKVIKDLVCDLDNSLEKLRTSKAYLTKNSQIKPTIDDEKMIELQSSCILCNSCYSACPVLEVNQNFLGPFALTRVYRYIQDVREEDKKSKIDTIQKDGIWDCTLCGECTIVCPQEIDPKMDIMMLRSKSGQYGYIDPSFSSGGFGDFNFGGF